MGFLTKFTGKQDNSGNGDSSGGTTASGFESGFNPEALNQYNFDAFKKGDFTSFNRITPEDLERAQKTAKDMKEQRKLHTGKLAADSESLDAAAAVFKSEQHHLRRRSETLLGAREEWVKTQGHFAEKIQPGLHGQNQSLSLSQTKGANAISEINNLFTQRRAAAKELVGGQGERIFSKAITQFCQLEEKHLVGVLFETKAIGSISYL